MRKILVLGAALGLAGCGGTAQNGAAANEAGSSNAAAATVPNQAADASANSAQPGAAAAVAEQILGRWGLDGDCAVNVYRFENDNSIYFLTGHEVGNWSLQGDRIALDLEEPRGTGTAELNGDRMTGTVGGRALSFTRCP